MTLSDATSILRETPEMRKALLQVVDAGISEIENRLLNASPTDEKAIIFERQRLDGARTLRAFLVKALGSTHRS